MDIKDLATNAVGETILKRYDDRPLYEQNSKPREDIGYSGKASPAKFYERKLAESAPNPSPLCAWALKELDKSHKGIENEWDLNEIKVAFRGIKNKWFGKIQANKEVVQKMHDYDKWDWNILMGLECVNKAV